MAEKWLWSSQTYFPTGNRAPAVVRLHWGAGVVLAYELMMSSENKARGEGLWLGHPAQEATEKTRRGLVASPQPIITIELCLFY